MSQYRDVLRTSIIDVLKEKIYLLLGPFLLYIISDFREVKGFDFSLIPPHILHLLECPRDPKNIFRLTIQRDLQEASTSSGSSFDEPSILLQPRVDHLQRPDACAAPKAIKKINHRVLDLHEGKRSDLFSYLDVIQVLDLKLFQIQDIDLINIKAFIF